MLGVRKLSVGFRESEAWEASSDRALFPSVRQSVTTELSSERNSKKQLKDMRHDERETRIKRYSCI